jgi:AcrR family transcriptional regulator
VRLRLCSRRCVESVAGPLPTLDTRGLDNLWVATIHFKTLRIVAIMPRPVPLRPPLPMPAKPWRTRERVMAAASRVLRRDGYARLTMERVAADSGVAKTTLYRRWPTKAALCMDLYFEVAQRELREPDTGDVARDLKEIAATVVRLQTRTVAGPALIGLIAEAHLNHDTGRAFLAEFAQRRRVVTRRALTRAIERGQVRRDVDVDVVIDALGGAVTFRLLQRHAPLTIAFTDALVDLVLSGCRPQPTPRRPRRSPRSQLRRRSPQGAAR